ncbi:hypothetical protein MCERE19_00150 [Spirosomataceae bacterium]
MILIENNPFIFVINQYSYLCNKYLAENILKYTKPNLTQSPTIGLDRTACNKT